MDTGDSPLAPRPPLFVWEPGDLSVYSSVRAAEQHLEAEDVRSGIYTAAFDSTGRRLNLGVRSEPRRILFVPTDVEVVTIASVPGASEQETFRPILVQFLERCGRSGEELRLRSWDELVRLGAKTAEDLRAGRITLPSR